MSTIKHIESHLPALTTPEASDGDCRRGLDRVHRDGIRCSIGEVRDLSPTGMRIVSNAVPKFTSEIDLYTLDRSMTVRGRVVWSRQVDHFKREVGIEFVGVKGRDKTEIRRISGSQAGL